ncbi:MAG: hypothetical protein IPP61_06675 [Cytophagaceae bacterium]|nr:hypothetical protein [Cytophagaceae bacterium]MBK9935582.1 hypothetical protein [Cytophagaceae bacterium]MBL0302027.1 hypothetical protein [Cytophagaceae bacterium]MBL0324850.1 hypothetical protein [Cytophagaceae bacterium]
MLQIINQATDFERGKEKTVNLNLAICGLARNVEHSIGKIFEKFEEVKSYFSEVYVVIVENDSTDNTKSILKNWSNTNARHILISEDLNENPVNKGPFSEHRISLMSSFRNKYLKEINKIPGLDYVMMVDLDIFDFSVREIISTFNHTENWDVVSANGQNLVLQFAFPVYFDVFALKEIGKNPIEYFDDIVPMQKKYTALCKRNEWIRVESGFNGLAIYRAACFNFDIRYEARISENESEISVWCEHVSFNQDLIKAGFNRQFINPGLKVKYLEIDSKIFWSNFYKYFKYLVGTLLNKIKSKF